MHFLRNMSLGLKINLLIIQTMVILAVVILGVEAIFTARLIDEMGLSRINQEVVVLERQLMQVQEELETAATLFSNTPGLVSAVAMNDVTALRSLSLGAVPALGVDDFDVVSAQGTRLVDTRSIDEAHEKLEDEIVAQTLLGIQRTSLVSVSQGKDSRLFLISARPLRDDTGTIVGGFYFTRELNDSFLNTLNFEREGIELSLVYNDQIIGTSFTLGESGSNNETQYTVLQSEFMATALSGDVTINPKTIHLGTVPYYEAYLPVQGLDDRSPSAVLLTRVNTGTIAVFRNNLLSFSSLLILLITSAVIVGAIVLVRSTLIRPLTVLRQATTNIAQGNYDVRLDIQGRDEIDQLAQTFNQMASDIQARQHELEDMNQSLEHRVADRTADLKQARDEALGLQRIAQENSRLKSEFLSTMSHELRTPLNAIEGFTSIMLGGMGVELSPTAEDMVRRVSANSKRLLNLINDFLDLSRIESGRLELVQEALSPKKLVRKWESEIGILAQHKHIEFVVNVSDDLPETVLSDEDALSKITLNLLSNAFKFTHQGRVSLDLYQANGDWAISVSDTGIGIPTHAREYIFDEFRQVDGSSKRLYGGTGLGLALVQKLSRAMGGNVNVQSEVGKGSTFTVTLPLELPTESGEGAQYEHNTI